MNNIFSYLNDKINNKDTFITATVTTISPLTVKIIPTDTAIPVVSTTNLTNLKVGSRVLLLRYNDQLIAISVIGQSQFITDYVIKQDDEVRNNTTTVSDDDELTLTLPPYGIYEIEVRLFVDAVSATPDIKVCYDTTNVTSLSYRLALGLGSSSTSVYNSEYMHFHSRSLSTETTYGLTTSGWAGIWEKFIVSTSSSNGVITLQYAQNVATAEDITMKANSIIKYTKIKGNN